MRGPNCKAQRLNESNVRIPWFAIGILDLIWHLSLGTCHCLELRADWIAIHI
jgi:hypothetical protein